MKSLMKNVCAAALMMAGSLSATAQAQGTLLLRDPDLSDQHITFAYAGDIWVADRNGANPRRLTSQAADERRPRLSPDGQTIAYMADYHGNTDVYTIPVAGGQPSRHTWHPSADWLSDWAPDGSKLLISSARERLNGRSAQLYEVSLDGGLPEKLMEARSFLARYDASGNRLASIAFGPAYNALYGGSSGWRGYRAGSAPRIQILSTDGDSWKEIPGDRVNDIEPMWLNGTVYFLSDREDEIFNLYRYDVDSEEVTKLTNETVWDIQAANAHGDAIIYEVGGALKTYDTATGEVTTLSVSLAPDLPQRLPGWKDASGQITAASLSKTGKRVAITARGEVFSVPVKDGSTRNISSSSGVREYDATWSPDGGSIAYIVERDRKQVLKIEDQSGLGDARTLPLGDEFYSILDWGGKGDHIVYQDNHLNLYSLNVESGRSTLITTNVRRDVFEADTSPDGKWLAYTREQANFNRDLYLFNFGSGESTKVTDGLADIGAPAFSKDGKLLFFTGSTNSGPTQTWLDMSTQERPYRAGIYAAVLQADGKSPLLPKAGDEEVADASEEETKDDKKDEKKEESVTVALSGLADRIVALPVAEKAYTGLATGDDGALYYISLVQPGIAVTPPGVNDQDGAQVMRFDFEDKKAETILTGYSSLSISADGKSIMLFKPNNEIHVGEVGKKIEAKPLNTSGLKLYVDPQEEWAQIFDDVWRMQENYFYDPDLHGADWVGIYARYKPLLEHVGRREDLNDLMREMISELKVGHNRLGGGDTHSERDVGVGLLGADLAVENGRTRIKKIYSGESWNPFFDAPLAEPGLGVSEGDYIIAVNGQTIAAGDNIFQYLAGTTGEQVALEVSSRADGRDSRTVTVEPTGSERMIRLWSWIEGNRRAVDEATDGKVGYVYLPNTAGAGYTFFNRMYFSQIDKDAMIIDERSNGGGQAANYITDVLNRTYLSGWKDRDGEVFNTPGGAMFGPKVMLIDQDAGSGGDFLPYSFRHMGIGTLIGTRTWGGLIGISANPGLADGGWVTVPYFRFFDANYEWTVENEGVAPDIEVALDPVAANNGRDSQLERAISEVMSQLATNPSTVPTVAPPYPTKLGE